MREDAKIRTELRKTLIELGLPAGDADETIDLSLHASEEASKILLRTVQRASESRISLCAFGIATSLTISRLESAQRKSEIVSSALGMTPHEIKLEL